MKNPIKNLKKFSSISFLFLSFSFIVLFFIALGQNINLFLDEKTNEFTFDFLFWVIIGIFAIGVISMFLLSDLMRDSYYWVTVDRLTDAIEKHEKAKEKYEDATEKLLDKISTM